MHLQTHISSKAQVDLCD